MPNVYICDMSKYKKQSHVVYKCDYHIVWVPKYRFRIMTGEIGLLMEKDIRMYSEWLGCEIVELNVQVDHVHVVFIYGKHIITKKSSPVWRGRENEGI